MKKLLNRIRNQNLSSKIFSLNYISGRYFKKGEINNLRCIFFNPLPFLPPPLRFTSLSILQSNYHFIHHYFTRQLWQSWQLWIIKLAWKILIVKGERSQKKEYIEWNKILFIIIYKYSSEQNDCIYKDILWLHI